VRAGSASARECPRWLANRVRFCVAPWTHRAHVEHVHRWVSADAAACLSAADAALGYAAIKSRREAAMAMTYYAFCKGLEYPSIVEASQRVAWTVRYLRQPPFRCH
jgi:hypothetical protein